MNTTRLEVQKTYKMFIGGAFPRTESGRYEAVRDKNEKVLVNSCRASRKDLRNAVVAAEKAQSGWAAKTAYLKGQILYRVAEIAEGRKDQLIAERQKEGLSKGKATKEVENMIDGVVQMAGWSDKYQQIFSAVNPVASQHFNFTILEPTGLVYMTLDNVQLTEWVVQLMGIIVSGNSVVLQIPKESTFSAMAMAEIFNVADIPGGVINILTGRIDELLPHAAGHMAVNALSIGWSNTELLKQAEEMAAENMKRLVLCDDFELGSPYWIKAFTEAKTTWHPIDSGSGGKGGY